MLPPVFQWLKASTDVKAIVGTNPPRVYRHGSAPERATDAPLVAYVTWLVVSGVPENDITGTPPVDRMSVQVDCWHPTDSGVESLALAVRDALEPHGHMTALLIDERESETKLYRMSLQFDFFEDR